MYRGYCLRRRNLWTDKHQIWDSGTSIHAEGSDAALWRARVANITADGPTLLQALDAAWETAEYEDVLGRLLHADDANQHMLNYSQAGWAN